MDIAKEIEFVRKNFIVPEDPRTFPYISYFLDILAELDKRGNTQLELIASLEKWKNNLPILQSQFLKHLSLHNIKDSDNPKEPKHCPYWHFKHGKENCPFV